MNLFNRNELDELLTEREGPCVSIFLPTHPGGGEIDPARLRRCLARAAEELYDRGLRPAEAAEMLRPAQEMLDDLAFWREQGESLAFFLAEGFARHYRLPGQVAESVAVDRHFRIVPLLPFLAGSGRFHVLALSRNGVRLLRGTQEGFSPVPLPEVPRNIEEALVTHDVDEPLNFHTRPTAGGGPWGAIFHGQGVGIDDRKDDLLRYFQKIDRGLRPILREETGPLVLAAVEYLHPIFREACTYPHLLPEGLRGSPDRLSDRELYERAWALVTPIFRASEERAVALYRQLRGTGRTVAGIEEVVPAAYHGEVEILFVPLGEEVWGAIDPIAGQLDLFEGPRPGAEELINLAAEEVLRHRGRVMVLPAGEMPAGAPLAAIHWLPLASHGKRG